MFIFSPCNNKHEMFIFSPCNNKHEMFRFSSCHNKDEIFIISPWYSSQEILSIFSPYNRTKEKLHICRNCVAFFFQKKIKYPKKMNYLKTIVIFINKYTDSICIFSIHSNQLNMLSVWINKQTGVWVNEQMGVMCMYGLMNTWVCVLINRRVHGIMNRCMG